MSKRKEEASCPPEKHLQSGPPVGACCVPRSDPSAGAPGHSKLSRALWASQRSGFVRLNTDSAFSLNSKGVALLPKSLSLSLLSLNPLQSPVTLFRFVKYKLA